MSKLIQVFALDSDGYTMNVVNDLGEDTIKDGKAKAKRILTDPEYTDHGLHKVELRVNGECIYDWFVA